MTSRRLFALSAALAPLALASCAVLGEQKPPPPCPPVYILADAGQITKYREGPGRDLTDVEAEVELVGFKGECGYDEKGANLSLELVFGATRGPADSDSKVEVEYFVAVPLYHPAPEAKAVFPLTITFPEGANYIRHYDEAVSLQVPVKDGDVIQKYEIYLGFQATPEQLERNRKAR